MLLKAGWRPDRDSNPHYLIGRLYRFEVLNLHLSQFFSQILLIYFEILDN